ncbi:MAG: GNAT family N-acetyltransferase [Vulcanimicrobiaceae bacterium]
MIVRTERCVVRRPAAADAAGIAKHANNRAVWLNLRDGFPHPYTLDDAVGWIAACSSEQPPVSFVIELDGGAIGGIGLKPGQDIERYCSEIGYWLGEEYWGRGIMTEVLRAFSEHALTALRFTRLFAVPIVWNPASCRVLEKAGFTREGILRSACVKDGRVADMALYAKVRD